MLHTRRILASLIVMSALGSVLGLTASSAAAATGEYAVVGMPYDGRWANVFATAPWEHPASHGDWSMDIYATNTPVRAIVPAASGEVSLRVDAVTTPGCSPNAGDEVRIAVAVDGVELGYASYMHLVDVSVEVDQVIDNGAVLGRTIAVDENFGFGSCWQVRFPKTGIHTHFEMFGSTEPSCFVKHDKGDELAYGAPLGQLGDVNDQTCVTGLDVIELPAWPDEIVDPGEGGTVSNTTPSAEVHETGYSSGELSDLLATAEELALTPAELQRAGVQVIRFINGVSGVTDRPDLEIVPKVEGSHRYATAWTAGDVGTEALDWVVDGYAISEPEAQKFGAILLVFFSGLN